MWMWKLMNVLDAIDTDDVTGRRRQFGYPFRIGAMRDFRRLRDFNFIYIYIYI